MILITIENHNGIDVLRDDLLKGGTKSILVPSICPDRKQTYVYASPVQGGFQIALAATLGKRAVVFCARRKNRHTHTNTVIDYGARVIEVPVGYLSVVEARADDWAREYLATRIVFGARLPAARRGLVERVRVVIDTLGREPKTIFCALGSGLLFESILEGTKTAKVVGVQVGKQYIEPVPKRGRVIVYPKPFDYKSKAACPFKSTPNYDLKAWEVCTAQKNKDVLFWNVY